MPSFNQNVNINRQENDVSLDNWGLTRHLSSSNVSYTSAYNGEINFPYTGEGVDIIIQESGLVNGNLSEFNDSDGNSRFVKYQWDQNFVANFAIDYENSLGYSNHATHVAGTAAGLKYGWAKDAKIYSLPLSQIPQIYWFDAIKRFHELKGNNRPTVVNASWAERDSYRPITKLNFRGELIDDLENISSRPRNDSNGSAGFAKKNKLNRYGIVGRSDGLLYHTNRQSFKDGVKSLTDAGIFYISSAGNGKQKLDEPGGLDYNNYFVTGSAAQFLNSYDVSYSINPENPLYYNRPSSNSSDGTILVGNLNNSFYYDEFGTNYTNLTAINGNDEIIHNASERGPGVDILAAGSNVNSVIANGGVEVYTGTSMSSPQIAGMTALLLEKWGNFTPKQLKTYWREYGISSLQINDLSLSPFTTFLSAGDPNHFGFSKRQNVNDPFTFTDKDSYLFACGCDRIAYLNFDVNINTLPNYNQNNNIDPTISHDKEINLSDKNLNTNKQNLSGYRYLKIVGSETIDSNFEFDHKKYYNSPVSQTKYSLSDPGVPSITAFPYSGGYISKVDFDFGDSLNELSTFSDKYTFDTYGNIAVDGNPQYFSSVADLTASYDYFELQKSPSNNKLKFLSGRSLQSESIRLTGSFFGGSEQWGSSRSRNITPACIFNGATSYLWRTYNGDNYVILDIGALSGYEYLYGNNSWSELTYQNITAPGFLYVYGKNTLSSVIDDDWELLGKISYLDQNDNHVNENTEVFDYYITKYFTDPSDSEITTFEGYSIPEFLPDHYITELSPSPSPEPDIEDEEESTDETLPDSTPQPSVPEQSQEEIDSGELALNFDPQTDEQCTRIVFDQNFDTSKDIYVSFQSPKVPRLITENGDFFLLTEDGDVIIVNTTSNLTLFLADGNTDVDTDPTHGLPGFGGGLMTTLTSTNPNMSGHFISMCLDFAGGYGLRGQFLDSGNKGNAELIPDSVTARVSTTNSEYEFLSTVAIPNFNILTTDFRTFRFVFKEHMNKIRLDLKTAEAEIFETVFEADTFINIPTMPSNVKVGLASSGDEPFSVKDITYSAN